MMLFSVEVGGVEVGGVEFGGVEFGEGVEAVAEDVLGAVKRAGGDVVDEEVVEAGVEGFGEADWASAEGVIRPAS